MPEAKASRGAANLKSGRVEISGAVEVEAALVIEGDPGTSVAQEASVAIIPKAWLVEREKTPRKRNANATLSQSCRPPEAIPLDIASIGHTRTVSSLNRTRLEMAGIPDGQEPVGKSRVSGGSGHLVRNAALTVAVERDRSVHRPRVLAALVL